MELTRVYKINGQMEKTAAAIRTAAALDPGDRVLSNNLAFLYLDAGREFNKAFELASAAYEKRPNDPAFADTLGWAYYHKGIYGQAVWYLKEAAAVIANNSMENSDIGEDEKAIVQYHLGMALKAKGDTEEAEKHLEKAVGPRLEDMEMACRSEN